MKTRLQTLPRVMVTWGLMLLTMIAGGVRPSCICADGSLCVFCPKLMATTAVSPSTEPSPTNGACSSPSCCCRPADAPTRSQSAGTCEWAGASCDGCDCLAVPLAAPTTVQAVEDPASRLGSDVVPAILANAELSLSRESFRSRVGSPLAVPPRDLIVLYQRRLI